MRDRNGLGDVRWSAYALVVRRVSGSGLLAVVLALCCGCPGGGGDDDAGDDAATGDDDVVDDDTGDDDVAAPGCGFLDAPPTATVDVYQQLYSAPDDDWRAAISGRVREHPDPQMYDVFLEDGACRYLQVDYGYCDPPCEHDELCTPDDTCVGYPAGVGAGALAVDIDGTVYALAAADYDPGLYSPGEELPAALFDAGAPVTTAFAGGDFPAVSLAAAGVARLETPLGETGLLLVPGEDATLTWTPGPDPDACVRVRLLGTNRGYGHGAPLNAMVWCEATDSGELVIPGQLVAWIALEGPFSTICVGHDCPPSEIQRYTRAAAETAAGWAELRVSTRATFDLLLESWP